MITIPAFRGIWYGCGTANTLPGNQFVYAGGKATYSAWHRPIAVYAPAVNRTYFVFGDHANRPNISYYDHAGQSFAGQVVLGENPDMNAHRNPTLHIDDDGYVFVFRGYASGGQPMTVLRSEKPHGIGDWTPRARVGEGTGSYPQPWQLVPGELFVTYREHHLGWACRISTDGAESWGPPTTLVQFGTGESPSVYGISQGATGPYPRTVHFVWSKLGGGTPEEVAAKHLWARRYNVYYAASDDGGRTWRRSDGTPYELPIREEAAEKIYDCGQHGVWLKDIQVDGDGRPNVLFIDAEVETYKSVWKFGRLAADGYWYFSDVARTGHMYNGPALVLAGPGDYRIYGPSTPSQPRTDGGEIDEWRSADRGASWSRFAQRTTGSKYSHNHVKTVLNHELGAGDFRVLWSYGDGTSPPATKHVFMYMYGETLERPRPIG
ncbi:MAG: BNR-4 repeat-containing protein [Candidatus Hydrogenedentes bacterium]|nr:BNR-4 repeat-containing protein [Candidatus Hydrogenedentota bacterium]